MNSTRKALVIVAALLTAATSLPIVSAADDPMAATPPPPGPHGPGEWGPRRLLDRLGLTAEQKASIDAIMTASMPQMKSLRQQMQANHAKLMQTKPDDPNYADVVAEVAQSNAALAAQHTNQEAELRSRMYMVLTPAQRSQLATLEASHGSFHRRHGCSGPR